MATAKPRITITLDQGVYDTLRGLSELQGVSMSSIVAELVTLIDPVQKQVLETMRRALALQGSAKADFVAQLEQAQVAADAAAAPLLGLLGAYFEGTQPPHSNTGVTHPNHQTEHAPKKPAKVRSRAGLSKECAAKEERKARDAEKMAETLREAEEDAEFEAAFRGLVEAGKDHEKAREELRAELVNLRRKRTE